MTSSDLTDRVREHRTEFWRGVGSLAPARPLLGDADEPDLWPTGSSAYVRVVTVHTAIIATDGLSDPGPSLPDGAGRSAGPGLGVELYVEGSELVEQDAVIDHWFVLALAEAAAAVAGTGSAMADALAGHDLLSLELSGSGAPTDWLADGRLGALLGVPLPARPGGFDVDGAHVRALSLVPLRPAELEVVLAEGSAGRRRVAEALADRGWYSYADSERPAVV